MYLKQSDLFTGLGHNFLKDTMAIAEKVSLAKGEFVFREAEPANHFFILIQGRVSLLLGESGTKVYTSSGTGEIFGCSSLIDMDTYFLSAKCEEPSVVLSIDQDNMHKILSANAENGVIFFKRLAAALGSRLMQMYRQFSEKVRAEMPD